MTAVDPLFAQWLMGPGQWELAEEAVLKARWGADAQTTERMTGLAQLADANAEALRQLAFFGGPLAKDVHLLVGEWNGFRGRVITLTVTQLGYDGGADVFVLGAEDDRATGVSRVTVLRRL